MAKNQDYSARNLVGANIYHVKNQTIYYNKIDKTAYIITNANVSSFTNWQLKTPLSVMLSCILIIAQVNAWIAIGAGIVVYGVATLLFNTKYLPTLSVSTTFEKPASKGFFRDIASNYSKQTLFIMMLMFISIGVSMFVIEILINKTEGYFFYVVMFFVVFSLICAGLIYYVISLKKKENL